MPVNFGDLTFMRVTADSSTPNELRAYDGFMIGLTAEMVAALPTGIDTITVSGIVVPGYKRSGSGGQIEWVMTPLPDPNVAMLNALPGPGGWRVPASRDTWANIGMELLRRGVSGEDLRAGFPLLFDSARAEVQAQAQTQAQVKPTATR